MSWLGCNVYVSEGRCAQTLQRLQAAAKQLPSTALVRHFVDHPYHRSSFTFLSQHPAKLCEAIVQFATVALDLIDLQQHEAHHPRLGAVDHISCHPMHSLGQSLGALGVPVLTYGAAHPHARALQDLRRALGYFCGADAGVWKGPLPITSLSHDTTLTPDFGPDTPPPHHGVLCLGAVPWVTNHNVLLDTGDVQRVSKWARQVSTRGGGLPAVEAMALVHADGTEIACNLLDVQVTSPADLVRRVEQIIAHQRDVRAHQDNMQGSDVPGGDVQGRDVQGGDVQGDVRIIRDYCINPPPATLVQEAQALIRGH